MDDLAYASVIVSYNRKALLKEAVKSLLTQKIMPKKILIIDNASTDGTESELEPLIKDNSRIKYYRLKTNMGGAFGFWFGLKEASKLNVDWISLSDDDAIYSENYFSEINDSIKQHKDVMAFTGTVQLLDGSIQQSHRRRVNSWNTLKQSEISVSDYEHNFDLDIFTFVGTVLSSKLIRKIGLPNKNYFIWYDDTEYSLRVRKYSRIINVSRAVVVHKTKLPKSSTNDPTDWKQYYGVRNQIITVKSHAKHPVLAVLYVVYRTGRRMCGTLLKKERKGHRMYMLQQDYRGLIDGLCSKSGANEKYMPR